ncbi:MAG: STAS domain-containing protein, partial [Chloroflexota bacterium]|nr:STAS domain-containing protein [Chloroflexota bacterium]
MIGGLEKLLEPGSKDPEVARRERVLNVVLVVFLAVSAVYLVYRAVEWRMGRGLLRMDFVTPIAFIALWFCYWLSRSGRIRLSAALVVALLFLSASYLFYIEGLELTAVLLGVLAVLVGGLLFDPPVNWEIAALVVVEAAVAAFAAQQRLLPPPIQMPVLASLGLVATVSFFLTLLTWLSTRELTAALYAARERADALDALDKERQKLVTDLTATMERQAQLLETVRELASPVAPVLEGIIVLPLVGHVDEERAQLINDSLLQGIVTHQARVVIIDFTGLVGLDNQMAQRMLRIARSARLLGVEVVLVG